MKIQVDNAYEDGHESTLFYELDDLAVPEDPDEMWDHLTQFTGDGHGHEYPNLGYCYTITILDAVNPYCIGLTEEIVGS